MACATNAYCSSYVTCGLITGLDQPYENCRSIMERINGAYLQDAFSTNARELGFDNSSENGNTVLQPIMHC